MTSENDNELTSISEQAAQWWVVFRENAASSADKREFAQWIVRAPERVEAYLRVARVHAALSRADLQWPKTSAVALIREAVASKEEPTPLRVQQIRPERVPRRRFPALLGVGLMASLLLAVGLGWHVLSLSQHYSTGFGEQLSVVLADGSRVTLNTGSRIEVRLRADQRVINLLQGEALFEIAHDPKRPFDVHVGEAILRDVGTRFDVDQRSERTVVTVVEGRVAILATGPHEGGDVSFPELSASDRAIIDNKGTLELQHGVNALEATAWTRRSLVFHRRPMAEVAEEFNRYNRQRIEIRSPALQAQEITGTFRSDDPASFLAFIAGIPGVHVTDDGRGGYVVTLEDSVP
jgi:transmembrane sensor